eukprot:m.95898 g.95898  ORF g.95898 m.95898 type:complete len:79 (-) comp8958_c0_seq30:1484-1720(-)
MNETHKIKIYLFELVHFFKVLIIESCSFLALLPFNAMVIAYLGTMQIQMLSRALLLGFCLIVLTVIANTIKTSINPQT